MQETRQQELLKEFHKWWADHEIKEPLHCEDCGRELKINKRKRGGETFDEKTGIALRNVCDILVPQKAVEGKLECPLLWCRLAHFILPRYLDYFVIDAKTYCFYHNGLSPF